MMTLAAAGRQVDRAHAARDWRNRHLHRLFQPVHRQADEPLRRLGGKQDSDLIDAYGYMAPADAVAAFTALGLAKDACVLDAGCGTGQAGALLAAAGYTSVDGATSRPKCATWRPASASTGTSTARHDGRLRAADRRRHRHRAGPRPAL